MTQTTYLVDCLFAVFDKSAIKDFRSFLSKHRQITKWQLAADFCMHNKDRPNNAYVFTLFPYDDHFDILKDEIRTALPKDFKKTKEIKRESLTFLSEQRRFHFGFVMNENVNLFFDGNKSDQLTNARNTLISILFKLEELDRGKIFIAKLKSLIQDSKAKNFNVRLLTDIFMLVHFFCFITVLLARECHVEKLGWFADRDNMTTWGNEIVWDFSTETLAGLSEIYKIELPFLSPDICIPDIENENNAMWFEEYIRPSDFMAGILSAWDFKKNELPTHPKYLQMAQEVLVKATNMAVIKVRYNEIIECTRITFGHEPSDI